MEDLAVDALQVVFQEEEDHREDLVEAHQEEALDMDRILVDLFLDQDIVMDIEDHMVQDVAVEELLQQYF